jgi:hypothetical protein
VTAASSPLIGKKALCMSLVVAWVGLVVIHSRFLSLLCVDKICYLFSKRATLRSVALIK